MHRRVFVFFVLLICILPAACSSQTVQPRVQLGADILMRDSLHLLRGKRVGLITNHTGRHSNGAMLVDSLVRSGINVVALFGPEHGVRGFAQAGAKVSDSVDAKTGIPIISLYGKHKKPTQEMLVNVDVLVYHIQDVGARFYTYISTMTLAMEAAAEKDIPFVVLDRPNPLGGETIDGPVMEDSLKSFIGMLPIPVIYGLTCGELARMINDEGWLTSGKRVSLTVIPMENWHRSMTWDKTGLGWVPPSPNIPTFQTAMIYPSACFVEATNVSEGRGTARPFETIGAPFMKGEGLSQSLKEVGLKALPTVFIPTSSKFKGETCEGVLIENDHEPHRPVAFGLTILQQLSRLWPEHVRFDAPGFARLMGNATVLPRLLAGDSVDSIALEWRPGLVGFRSSSTRYLLYK